MDPRDACWHDGLTHLTATSHRAVSDDGPARRVLARRSHLTSRRPRTALSLTMNPRDACWRDGLTHLTATSHCAVSDDEPARRVLARRPHLTSRRPRTALSLTVIVILSQLSLLASATPVSAAGQRLQQLGRSQFPFCLFVYLFI